LTITCRNEANDRDIPVTIPRGDYVRVSVTDSGSGMSEVTLEKAMEPFFTTKGVGKGTGLGLSMVHGLTAQCGGAMNISSQLGRGTVVTLWLPRAREGTEPKAVEEPLTRLQDTEGRKLNILLVDDDPLVSMNTADMLMDLGHSVLESNSASQALQLLQSNGEFDVVVTDYAMPGMTGLDLAIKIKQMKPEYPVILATGYGDLPPNAPLGIPRLTKPYSQEELAKVLERAVPSPP
jgi:CheY-like chemotaxis protein